MKVLKKGFLSFAALLLSFGLFAQAHVNISELVSNPHDIDGLVNNVGVRSSWIEIYNPTYATIDIGTCYITDDVNNPKKYRIPQISETKIAPLQHLIIWADGVSSHGALYTNFQLNPAGGYLALYSSDGKTLIDKVDYPAMKAGEAYARKDDGDWTTVGRISPLLPNFFDDNALTKSQIMQREDPVGVVITIIAMGVVFLLLIILFLCFKQLGKLHVRASRKKAAEIHGVDVDNKKIQHVGHETGDIYAVIALALQLYQDDIHDIEDMVITIESDTKMFSPWNSKVQTLRQTPVVKTNK
jgi:Na+-transporting methylmalonyl-CoA/oxaloacetate decarboxylase gamma subunit